MAKSKAFTRKITRKVVDHVPGYVELNLSPEEAAFLLAVMGRIGGCWRNSPRKHADAILGELLRVGVTADSVPGCWDKKNSIYFHKYS